MQMRVLFLFGTRVRKNRKCAEQGMQRCRPGAAVPGSVRSRNGRLVNAHAAQDEMMLEAVRRSTPPGIRMWEGGNMRGILVGALLISGLAADDLPRHGVIGLVVA